MNCLVDHCQRVHKWREIPCTSENCNFVAYNNKSSTSHKASFHSKHRQSTNREFQCNWKNCKTSFTSNYDLQRHLRIHTNNLSQCVFCPYRTNLGDDMKCHYRFHFKMYEEKCDYCDKKFISKKYLNSHYKNEHSSEKYTCHICTNFTGSRNLLQIHMIRSHNLLSRWNEAKKMLETFSRD